MTAPSTPEQKQPGPRPQRLLFITLPLLIGTLYFALQLLTVPFSGPLLNDVMLQINERFSNSGIPPVQLAPEQLQWVLWISFAVFALLILWLYFTRRALLEGRSWGRVSAIVIGVLSLLALPIGTVLGVFILIGAFDRDVMAYTRR
ncbi:hypothetical protein [Deinococcus frigens]|uniref:hypothetical protein n=1 Tax=Deinococcus frigens TaxID=249403 RepID=UPI0004969751|nr:hypothetical protein [Deinococcus frigens]